MNYSETCGVTLSVLRFACRTIEQTHSDYIIGIAFETLHAVSLKFKHCLKGSINILLSIDFLVFMNLYECALL